MPPKGAIQISALILRVLLGAWFAWSGGVKVFSTGLDRFTRDVANYRLVGEPLDAVVAYSLPWLELVTGICLILGILLRGSILATAWMVWVFAVAIGWAWAHNLDISCGCRGGDEPIHYWGKVTEFALYFAVLGWLWWAESKRRSPQIAAA